MYILLIRIIELLNRRKSSLKRLRFMFRKEYNIVLYFRGLFFYLVKGYKIEVFLIKDRDCNIRMGILGV